MHWLAVALGGALGAMGRYGVTAVLYSPTPVGKLPLGTLTVNVLGSLVIGALYIIIVEKGLMAPHWKSLLIAGFLGAFTTFSTFALESFSLLQHGHYGMALAYTLISVTACILAVALGCFITLKFI